MRDVNARTGTIRLANNHSVGSYRAVRSEKIPSGKAAQKAAVGFRLEVYFLNRSAADPVAFAGETLAARSCERTVVATVATVATRARSLGGHTRSPGAGAHCATPAADDYKRNSDKAPTPTKHAMHAAKLARERNDSGDITRVSADLQRQTRLYGSIIFLHERSLNLTRVYASRAF
ncbi:MAG: hypothetical protein ABI548_25255 [Polyangiaceae bacterium]